MQRVADLLLRHPRAAFAGIVALSLAAALVLLVGGVRFDYNLENFLPASDPTIRQYRAFTEDYEPDDVFIAVGFEAEDVFAYETLADIRAMTAALERLDGVEDVISATSIEGLR